MTSLAVSEEAHIFLIQLCRCFSLPPHRVIQAYGGASGDGGINGLVYDSNKNIIVGTGSYKGGEFVSPRSSWSVDM